MAHFAKIDNTNTVVDVIVATQEFIDSGAVGNPSDWIQTSYNTRGGVHELGGTPLRKNYAGIGFNYDREADAFHAQQPYPSWVLNQETFLWNPPVPYPSDASKEKEYTWDEETITWKEVK